MENNVTLERTNLRAQLTSRLKEICLHWWSVGIHNSCFPHLNASIFWQSDKQPQHWEPRKWCDWLWTCLRTSIAHQEILSWFKNKNCHYSPKVAIITKKLLKYWFTKSWGIQDSWKLRIRLTFISYGRKFLSLTNKTHGQHYTQNQYSKRETKHTK